MDGELFLCATPIGNLEDITIRVLRILKEVDMIAAEDTRHTIKLLNHFGIKTKMTSYHEYNKVEKAELLIGKMKDGMTIALVTDAGTPGISDPGEVLVSKCRQAGIPVTGLPGACALIDGLIISGQSSKRFCFEGFLPKEKKLRKSILKTLKNETRTIILYEAPHHLNETLDRLYEALGDREISVCRELTKQHETVFMTTLSEAKKYYEDHSPKGECVLVIQGLSMEKKQLETQKKWLEMDLSKHMDYYYEQGYQKKDAMKKVACDRGVSKSEIYRQLLSDSDLAKE